MWFRPLAASFFLLASPAMAFDIEAHRGGRGLFPENTLQAFAAALAMGVDTLELDVGVTRDGVLVVSHERRLNPDLARDASGNYVAPPGPLLIELPLAEVQSYDIGQIRPGSAYAKQFPEQHALAAPAVPPPRIPTLKEVIDLVRSSGNTTVRLNIETKLDPDHPTEAPEPERFVTLLLDLLKAENFTDRVMIQSFDWRTLQLVQARAGYPDRLSHPAARQGADRVVGCGHELDRGLQSSRPWRLAATYDCRSRRRSLVALFPGRHACAGRRGAYPEAARRGLDRQQAGGHGAPDGHGRRWHHLGPAGFAAQGRGRQGVRKAAGSTARSTAWAGPSGEGLAAVACPAIRLRQKRAVAHRRSAPSPRPSRGEGWGERQTRGDSCCWIGPAHPDRIFRRHPASALRKLRSRAAPVKAPIVCS